MQVIAVFRWRKGYGKGEKYSLAKGFSVLGSEFGSGEVLLGSLVGSLLGSEVLSGSGDVLEISGSATTSLVGSGSATTSLVGSGSLVGSLLGSEVLSGSGAVLATSLVGSGSDIVVGSATVSLVGSGSAVVEGSPVGSGVVSGVFLLLPEYLQHGNFYR